MKIEGKIKETLLKVLFTPDGTRDEKLATDLLSIYWPDLNKSLGTYLSFVFRYQGLSEGRVLPKNKFDIDEFNSELARALGVDLDADFSDVEWE